MSINNKQTLIVSPRMQKIISNSSENNGNGIKGVANIKNNNSSSSDNKSLENTLRNRRIIVPNSNSRDKSIEV